MVALSPKSLAELGYAATDEEKDRAFLEVSGRKGLGVKADDLLDRLEDKAGAEVAKRNPDLPEAESAGSPGRSPRGPCATSCSSSPATRSSSSTSTRP